ncbi:MAG TPA: glycosyltransferase family 4 protein [Sphingobium sp.]|nr:glycosyltransferase family 4 protein [Sphingobium sp.]
MPDFSEKSAPKRSGVRVFYVAAAGDLVGSYESWSKQVDVETEVAKTYSGSIFDFVNRAGHEGLFISTSRVGASVQDASIRVENIQIPAGRSGVKYYVDWMVSSAILLKRCLTYKPDVAVVSDRRIFFPFLFVAKLYRIKVINVMHVAFFSDLEKPKGFKRLLLKADSLFIRWGCDYLLGVSQEIIDQSWRLCRSKPPQGAAFIPQWRRDRFDRILDIRPSDEVFSLTFLGRMERNKGIFDLLRAFCWLRDKGYRVTLAYLGDGGALGELRAEIERLGLADVVSTYGHCSGDQVIEALAQTHLVVVPTRSEFVEGLNKVAIEAVLSGRPVVTSQVCQALSLIREAAFEATPDDWTSYARCIEHAIIDPVAYNDAVGAARRLRRNFFDPSQSIGHKLEKAFTALRLVGDAEEEHPAPIAP